MKWTVDCSRSGLKLPRKPLSQEPLKFWTKYWKKSLKSAAKVSKTSRRATKKDKRSLPHKNQDFWTKNNWKNSTNWSAKMKQQCKNLKIKSTPLATTLKSSKNICTTSTKEFTIVSGNWRSGHKTSRTQSDKRPESSKKDKPNSQTNWIPKRNSSLKDWTKSKRNWTI